MPPERFVEPPRMAVAAKVHGGLDGAAGFDEGERVFQPQAAQASGDLPVFLLEQAELADVDRHVGIRRPGRRLRAAGQMR